MKMRKSGALTEVSFLYIAVFVYAKPRIWDYEIRRRKDMRTTDTGSWLSLWRDQHTAGAKWIVPVGESSGRKKNMSSPKPAGR